MLEPFLTYLGAAHVGIMVGMLLDQGISILLEQTSEVTTGSVRCRTIC